MHATTTLIIYTGTSTNVAYSIENYPYYSGATSDEFLLVSAIIISLLFYKVLQSVIPMPRKIREVAIEDKRVRTTIK